MKISRGIVVGFFFYLPAVAGNTLPVPNNVTPAVLFLANLLGEAVRENKNRAWVQEQLDATGQQLREGFTDEVWDAVRKAKALYEVMRLDNIYLKRHQITLQLAKDGFTMEQISYGIQRFEEPEEEEQHEGT